MKVPYGLLVGVAAIWLGGYCSSGVSVADGGVDIVSGDSGDLGEREVDGGEIIGVTPKCGYNVNTACPAVLYEQSMICPVGWEYYPSTYPWKYRSGDLVTTAFGLVCRWVKYPFEWGTVWSSLNIGVLSGAKQAEAQMLAPDETACVVVDEKKCCERGEGCGQYLVCNPWAYWTPNDRNGTSKTPAVSYYLENSLADGLSLALAGGTNSIVKRVLVRIPANADCMVAVRTYACGSILMLEKDELNAIAADYEDMCLERRAGGGIVAEVLSERLIDRKKVGCASAGRGDLECGYDIYSPLDICREEPGRWYVGFPECVNGANDEEPVGAERREAIYWYLAHVFERGLGGEWKYRMVACECAIGGGVGWCDVGSELPDPITLEPIENDYYGPSELAEVIESNARECGK